MIRDYPDVVPATPPSTSVPPSSASSIMSLSPPGTPTTPTSGFPPNFASLPPPTNSTIRSGHVLPPPRHPPTGHQTTYTPYVPRRARRPAPSPLPLSPSGLPVPLITSSSQGGVTTRHPVASPLTTPGGKIHEAGGGHHNQGPSFALLDKVRALDALPRLGALRTLDLRGNDLRVSVILTTYFSRI
jgi:protein phosphatase 1 regulatory subunit 37